MYPRLPNIYRKFDGIEYAHWEWEKTRIDAQHEATMLRAKGYKARVTKATNTLNETYYAVWKNPVTSIEFARENQRHIDLGTNRTLGTALTGKY